MDMLTLNKIMELALHLVQAYRMSGKKPMEKSQDLIIIVASIIIAAQYKKGLEWRDEQLKKFGFNEGVTKEEVDFILKEAEKIVLNIK